MLVASLKGLRKWTEKFPCFGQSWSAALGATLVRFLTLPRLIKSLSMGAALPGHPG